MTAIRPVDFDAIPVHVHQTSYADNVKLKCLKPGIHYAVRRCGDIDALLETLREGLVRHVSEEATAFAGLRSGVIPRPHQIDAEFTVDELDDLYLQGFNPLRRKGGDIVVWGSQFVDVHGKTQRMIQLTQFDYCARYLPHPGLYQLAQTVRPIFYHPV